MALERKTAFTKLDPAVHEVVNAICNARGITIAEFIESLVLKAVNEFAHEHSLTDEAVKCLLKAVNRS